MPLLTELGVVSWDGRFCKYSAPTELSSHETNAEEKSEPPHVGSYNGLVNDIPCASGTWARRSHIQGLLARPGKVKLAA